MTLSALALAVVLSQTETPAADRAAAAAERAAAAAERAAAAAEKSAAALERLADLQAPAAAAPAAVEVKKESWTGLVGIGLISLTGNSESLTGTANAQADRKFGKWAFGVRATSAYGQTRPLAGGEAQVTAARALLSARLDRSIASFASIYAQAGVETDHLKSIEVRGYGEVGTGIVFFERKEPDFERVYLRGDLALHAAQEARFQYYAAGAVPAHTGLPPATLIAPRIGVVLRYAVNKEIRFSEEAEVLPNLLGEARFLFNSTTKLNARLTAVFGLTASFLVSSDSAPAPGKQTTDTALTIGAEATF